jgi:hypothetical protein
VAYQYSWAGRSYVGKTYREDYLGSADLAKADRLTRDFPVGSQRIGFINPRNPSEAVLAHESLAFPAALAIANLLGGAYLTRFLLRSGRRRPGTKTLVGLGDLFLIVPGLGVYVSCFGLPLGKGLCSLGWRATPCVIESGQVRSVLQRAGWFAWTCYWSDVAYRYEFAGTAYRSNTYNASDVGSPWYYGMRGIVHRHPPGMRAICYVNPSDPSESVLVRTPSGTQWFGVWPLVMVVLGAAAMIERTTGRVIRVGMPRLWSTLVLGAITTSALTSLWIAGADLLRDGSEGIAEWPEYLTVAVAAALSAGWMAAWIALAIDPHGSKARCTTSPKSPLVWDPEIDRGSKGKAQSR